MIGYLCSSLSISLRKCHWPAPHSPQLTTYFWFETDSDCWRRFTSIRTVTSGTSSRRLTKEHFWWRFKWFLWSSKSFATSLNCWMNTLDRTTFCRWSIHSLERWSRGQWSICGHRSVVVDWHTCQKRFECCRYQYDVEAGRVISSIRISFTFDIRNGGEMQTSVQISGQKSLR